MRDAVTGAVEYYHELLESKHFSSTAQALETAITQRGLSVAGRPVCSVLRPQFLDAEAYKLVLRASQLVLKGFRELASRLLTDPSLRAVLELKQDEEEIALIETGYGPADVSARLDGFLDAENNFRFVEYNADSPGGIAFGDVLAEVFSSMPVLQEFARRFPYHTLPARAHTFDVLLKTYQNWGGHGIPNIAIVDWRNTPTRNEFELMREHFEARGAKVRILDPDELDTRNGKLCAGDFEIDLVYKRIVVFELLERLGLQHPLVRAVRDRAVCMANGFAVQLLFQKSLFAMLSDPAFYNPADPDVADALQRHLPWTRLVRESKTQYNNTAIDLLPFIAENKDRLVLKPCSDYGGKGVWLGWELRRNSGVRPWHLALRTSHIVQERVTLGAELYPSIAEGKLSLDERYFDLDPYVWHGQSVEGSGVRLSRGAILNVSAGGGSATPLFVLRK